MKAAILGCLGQVGAEAMARASSLGIEAIGIGRAQIDLGLANVDDLTRLLAGLGCHAAINCAAYTNVAQAESFGAAREGNPNWEANARLPGRLGEACARIGIPAVHFSTDYVFDGAKGSPLLEDDAAAPLNAYGLVKLEGEAGLAASGARHATLRAAAIFGPSGANNFPSKILAAASRLPRLEVVDDQLCSPVPAGSCASAALLCAQRLAQGLPTPTLMHLASDRSLSFHRFACEIVALAWQAGIPMACRPENIIASKTSKQAVARPTDSRLDGGLFLRSVHRHPFSLDEGLRFFIQSFNLAPNKESA